MTKKNIEALKRAWIAAANMCGVHPYDLKRQQLRDNSPAGSFSYTLQMLGGFNLFKEKHFSPSSAVTPAPKPAKQTAKPTKGKKKTKPADDTDFDPGEEPKPPNPLETTEAQELQGEALEDYVADIMLKCARIININPHELTWQEFAQYINRHYGIDNMGVAKYTITRAGGFNQLRDRRFAIQPTTSTVAKIRSREEANYNRKLGQKFAQEKYVLETLESFADRTFKGQIIVTRPTKLVKVPVRRVLNALFSDLHIGADIDQEETGYQDYKRVEEARRFAYIVKTIANYKMDYRQDTKLSLIFCGDLIQNQLHDPHDGAAIAEQVARAIHLLKQGIGYLSGYFQEVDTYWTPGNHDRIMSEHKSRAVNRKWNSWGTIIAFAVRSALSNVSNVTFNIPKTPFVTYEALGHRTFATHSDTVFDVGRPSKTVKVDRIESQVDKWNSSLPDDQKYSVIACGHIHRLMFQRLDGGGALFTNGPLDPSDAFAVSIGCPYNQAGQWMWETTEEFACGDKRDVLVGLKQDKDSSLDSIIEPFVSF
jgi:hypothetical protein